MRALNLALMVKRSFHIFLSFWLLLVSLASEHQHEHSQTISLTDIADSDAHCDLCAMKSALQNCQISQPSSVESRAPKLVSVQPSFSSYFVFHFSPRLPLRAPPQALFNSFL